MLKHKNWHSHLNVSFYLDKIFIQNSQFIVMYNNLSGIFLTVYNSDGIHPIYH